MDLLKTIVIGCLGLFEAIAVAIGVVNIPKRKKADLIVKKEFAMTTLPSVIKFAESSCKNAVEKKEIAVSCALSAVEKRFGVLCNSDKITMTQYISDSVENILSTPQKKGE